MGDENKIVTDVLTDLLSELMGKETNLYDLAFSEELQPAFAMLLITFLEKLYEGKDDLNNYLAVKMARRPIRVAFEVGISIGFNLAQKESPLTYADNYVRRKCEEQGVDFQAIADAVKRRGEE